MEIFSLNTRLNIDYVNFCKCINYHTLSRILDWGAQTQRGLIITNRACVCDTFDHFKKHNKILHLDQRQDILNCVLGEIES